MSKFLPNICYRRWNHGYALHPHTAVFGYNPTLQQSNFSTDSTRRHGGKHQRVFLDVKSCQTMEELADMTYKRLGELSPRNLSSFWSRVPQLLTPKYQSRNHHRDQNRMLINQLRSVFLKTMGDIKKFGPRDLATTALGFGKILQKVDNQRRRQNESIEQILYNLLSGKNSQQKELIFRSIANASVLKMEAFDPV